MDKGVSHRDKAKPLTKHNSKTILTFLLQNQLTKSPKRGKKKFSKLKLKKPNGIYFLAKLWSSFLIQ